MVFSFRRNQLWTGDGQQLLAKVKTGFSGRKSICAPDGTCMMQTVVRKENYLLLEPDGKTVAEARPKYARGEDPAVSGPPINRHPFRDQAVIIYQGENYLLSMEPGRVFRLYNQEKTPLLRILPQRWFRGWQVEGQEDLSPVFMCAVLAFSQYLEQENSFCAV